MKIFLSTWMVRFKIFHYISSFIFFQKWLNGMKSNQLSFSFFFFRNKLFKSKRGTVWHCSRFCSSRRNYIGINLISTKLCIYVPLPQVEWFHQNYFVPNVYSWHSWDRNNDYWCGNSSNQERTNLCDMLHDPLLWIPCSIHGYFFDGYDINFEVCKTNLCTLLDFYGLSKPFIYFFQILYGLESI